MVVSVVVVVVVIVSLKEYPIIITIIIASLKEYPIIIIIIIITFLKEYPFCYGHAPRTPQRKAKVWAAEAPLLGRQL